MKKIISILTLLAVTMTAAANDYDLNKPFGFCTRSSRTDASSTFAITGGGCDSYPIPDDFSGKAVVLKSNGQDMKGAIQNAIKQNDVVILDGADGDFIVSSNIGFERGNKTLLGINNARLCTKWYMTDDIKAALDAAGVPSMSTSGGGGTLPNGQYVKEEAEYNSRKIIMEMTGDTDESYRNAGILSLNKDNVIIRNITFVGPGSVDVGGSDLISCSGAKHCWVDHCVFLDGMDGNFDITQSADFITVSWCIFQYTGRSYMHQNTNLIGSSDSEAKGYLNTTFAFNWWSMGCKQRMPLGRVGKIHMLNNYFSSTTAGNCINPRKSSEFLIEGNYFAKGVKNYYSQSGATAVTWASTNYAVETNKLGDTSSFGTTVTMPYDYTVAPADDVPSVVTENAGATLKYGESSGGEEPEGTKGSIYWPMSSNTNATVAEAIAEHITSTSVDTGSNLTLNGNGTYGNVRFSRFQAQTIQTAPADDNAVTFTFMTKNGYLFKATSVEVYACKVGTNYGNIDISWKDAGGKTAIVENDSPNRNNESGGYFSIYSHDVSSLSTATEGTCSLIVNCYNVGATNTETGDRQKKDIGLAEVTIKGYITDSSTGISTPVSISTARPTYYNIKGQQVDANARGLLIIRQQQADGSIKTMKIYK